MAALKINDLADIIIVDGGTTDGSLQLSGLKNHGVRGLLLKTGPGKQKWLRKFEQRYKWKLWA